MKGTLFVLFVGIIYFVSAPVQAATNLLVNGGFDTYTVSPSAWTAPYYADYNVAVGTTAITGWTVSRGAIDYLSPSFSSPQNGVASIDLVGSPGNGGIKQSFATTPGHVYQASFYISGNPDTWDYTHAIYQPNKLISVEVAGQKHDYEYDVLVHGNSYYDMKWQLCTFDFTANTAMSTIEFYSTMPYTCYSGMVLDNVSIEAVPEPSALALLGMGGMGILFWARRWRMAVRRAMISLLLGIGMVMAGQWAVAADLFVSDLASNSIYKYLPDGSRSLFAGGLNGPTGLAFDRTGNLFSVDVYSGNIYRFTPDGSRSTFASGLKLPQYLAFDSSGDLFVSAWGSDSIYRYSPDGSRSTFASGLYHPYCMAFDKDGTLFVSDYYSDRIYSFTPNGSRSIFASELDGPTGMAFDSSGNLFQADLYSGNIYKFSPNGSRSTFASGLYNPIDLAFDSSGDLYATSAGFNAIYRFTPSGTRSVFASDLMNVRCLAFAPVPEPSALALLGIGGISLLAFASRRNRTICLTSFVMVVVAASAGIVQADVCNMGGTRNADGTWNGLASLETVPVGNINNAVDATTGYGSVDYSYAIGKYEVTAGQYTEFLNKVAATDAFGLYNSGMWSDTGGCKIQRSGTSGSFTYSVAADYANRPVNYVSWGDAARFINWLENGQKTYVQDPLTTENGSYTLGGHTDSNYLKTVVRNPGRQYYIPTENEWYKAAYYDPNKGGTGGYWLYPMKTDNPYAIGQDMTEATHPGNNANCSTAPYTYPLDSGHYTTVVGEFQMSASAYGTFDQGGNVWEWFETPGNSYDRGTRGGSFFHNASFLASTSRFYNDTSNAGMYGGFRVASVPEPSTIALLLTATLGGLLYWRRRA